MPSTVTVSTPAPGAGIAIMTLADWFALNVPIIVPPYAGGAADELAQPPSSGGSKGPVPALSPCPRAGLAALRRPTCPDGAGFLVLSSPGPWALGALRASAGGGGPGGGAPSPGTEAR